MVSVSRSTVLYYRLVVVDSIFLLTRGGDIVLSSLGVGRFILVELALCNLKVLRRVARETLTMVVVRDRATLCI